MRDSSEYENEPLGLLSSELISWNKIACVSTCHLNCLNRIVKNIKDKSRGVFAILGRPLARQILSWTGKRYQTTRLFIRVSYLSKSGVTSHYAIQNPLKWFIPIWWVDAKMFSYIQLQLKFKYLYSQHSIMLILFLTLRLMQFKCRTVPSALYYLDDGSQQ